MYHKNHGDSRACVYIGSFFSGLPKALRDEGLLMVLQAWFDESGKNDPPVFVLAGYVGKKDMWESFADDWQAELDREPRLPYLHVKESQTFKGFTPTQRTERLLRFVEIIKRHQPTRVTFMLRHDEYREFFNMLRTHPTIQPEERRMLKNPYFTGFVLVLNIMLMAQAKKRADTGIHELVEILFDKGGEREPRLQLGFRDFVATVRRHHPEFLDLMLNTQAEFRDDKVVLPLQASDLLAWHLRRLCFELARSNRNYEHDPVWSALFTATESNRDYRYSSDQWMDLLLRIRKDTWTLAEIEGIMS